MGWSYFPFSSTLFSSGEGQRVPVAGLLRPLSHLPSRPSHVYKYQFITAAPHSSLICVPAIMRRAGSRYGLPPTNRSLKHAMVDFQNVKGPYAYVLLPGEDTVVSLNKGGRWAWTAEAVEESYP